MHDRFVEMLHDRIDVLHVGDPSDEDTDMGPLTTPGVLRLVRDHVADAKEHGASVMQAGEEDGLLYRRRSWPA